MIINSHIKNLEESILENNFLINGKYFAKFLKIYRHERSLILFLSLTDEGF